VNLTWGGYPEKKPNPSQNKEEKDIESSKEDSERYDQAIKKLLSKASKKIAEKNKNIKERRVKNEK